MRALIASAVFDLVGRIAAMHSLADVWRHYVVAARHAGLPYGILVGLSPTRPIRDRLVASSMCDGWLAHFEQHQYESLCPVMAQMRRSAHPFVWNVHDWDGDEKLKAWREDTIASGITGGVAVTYRGQGEGQAIVMSGPVHDTHPNDRRVLHFAGLAALQRMEELAVPRVSTVHLSERERECLTWVAAGKNDWEIGMILGVSNKTVNCHVERAKHKLGAVTRMQAVVKAYHQRLIEI